MINQDKSCQKSPELQHWAKSLLRKISQQQHSPMKWIREEGKKKDRKSFQQNQTQISPQTADELINSETFE